MKARHRERLRAITRQAILAGAEAVLLRDGLDATTLDAIAAELGWTKQGLYYHYASKEALLAELALQEWTAAADAVQAATTAAAGAPEALEALVRTYVGRYSGRLQVFRLATQGAQLSPLAASLGRQQLAAFRPLNDRMYGPTEQKLREARRAGAADPALDPRRLTFVAHTSAMGLLGMLLMVGTVDDPLRHSEKALVDELCRALRSAVGGRGRAG
ncbi:MAG: TetR/AcrR family transcriptional regulator [Rubrivivax sp.]|nr:TetR/AcrR family transcriptional regulator [Rubrivivax sp.]